MKKSYFEILTGFVIGFVLCGFALWFFSRSKARQAAFRLAPQRITALEADDRMIRGFAVTDREDNNVHFGVRAKNYLDKKRDGKARKTFLLWAQETVEFGSRELDKDRAIYRLVFKDFSADGADKGFIVLVSVKEGEVWDFYRIPARKTKERQTRDKAP